MTCSCKTTHEFPAAKSVEVPGKMKPYDDVRVIQCSRCEALWLRVSFDSSLPAAAEHWFDALLAQEPQLKNLLIKESVENVFMSSPVSFQGGTLFGGKVLPFKGLPRRLI